jgi:hypothetical protein
MSKGLKIMSLGVINPNKRGRPLERDNLVVYYFSASKNWTDKR